MRHLNNERGNGLVYMLWIMVVSIAICVIVLNIAKVYIVKQQAATATQQAALAGSSVLVNATKKAVEAFDLMGEHDDVILQLELDEGKSISMLINEKADEYRYQGLASDIVYIKAMNDILPQRMLAYTLLDDLVDSHLESVKVTFGQTVRDVVVKNGGNPERIKVKFNDEFQVEVEADVTYKSITDSAEEFIRKFKEEIPQKGKGPTLKFVGGM